MFGGFNPLFPSLTDVKDDVLNKKVDELQKKYLAAATMGNMAFANQIHTLLEHYRQELNLRNQKYLDELAEKMNKNKNRKGKGGSSVDDLIDV